MMYAYCISMNRYHRKIKPVLMHWSYRTETLETKCLKRHVISLKHAWDQDHWTTIWLYMTQWLVSPGNLYSQCWPYTLSRSSPSWCMLIVSAWIDIISPYQASANALELPHRDIGNQVFKTTCDQFENMHEIKTIGQQYDYIWPSGRCHQVIYTHKVGLIHQVGLHHHDACLLYQYE